jgi:signal transduction histidine kinase
MHEVQFANSGPSRGAFAKLAATLALAAEERVLFALRLPAIEELAWREGRGAALARERDALAAFARVCRRTLRRGDALAHEPGSNLFLAALLAPGIDNDVIRTAHVVLSEITRELETATGSDVESGWTMYRRADDPERTLAAAAAAALERGRRARERYAFFSTFGHEMRTPLTSIDGYLTAVLESDLAPPTRQRFTEIARLEAARLRRLVESMYALSLIDLDTEIVRNVSCSVQRAVDAACDAIYPAAARRGTRVRVRSSIEAGIPFAAEHAVQMFLGLLENAVKHGRDDGRIEIALSATPNRVTLFFDDDGPGVIAGERTAIFEPLVRGRGATAAGHGLGLSIARTAVERAGGDISVGPSPLGGARFVVELPRTDVPSPERALHV